jgi:integrase
MPRHNQGPYLSDERNAHGVFEIRWTENGRSKRKSTGEGDYRKAQRIYAEFLLALDEVAEAQTSVTIEQVISAYVADKTDVMDRNSQEVTFGHLKTHFGALAVTEIEERDVASYLTQRAAGLVSFVDAKGRVRGGKKAGEGTVRRELGMLSTAIAHCIDKKRFKDAQGRPVLKPHDKPYIELPAAPAARDRWLSRDEARSLLAAAAAYQDTDDGRLPRVYRYIALMLYTAARRETVFSLTWDRIQIDRGLINFQVHGRRVTKKRRGWVPIGAELKPILERAHRERCSEFFLDRPTPPHKAFRTVAKRAGVTQVSPHVLRHTWATWAAQDGVSLFDIAGVLHDTVATVEKKYAHHCPEHLRNAVNRPLLLVGGTDVEAA